MVDVQVHEKQGMSRSQEEGQAQLAAAREESEGLQRQLTEAAAAAQEHAGLLESCNRETEKLRYGLRCECSKLQSKESPVQVG